MSNTGEEVAAKTARYHSVQTTGGCKGLQEARPLGEVNLSPTEYFILIVW